MEEQPQLELDDRDEVGPTFSVGQLTTLVRDAMRRAFPDQVWVRGEVQNLTRSSAGHTYFTLVEKAGRGDRVQARLDVVLFRDDRRAVVQALAEVPGAELGNDVEVRIRGRVTVYPGLGRLQLVMSGIDPVFTVGGIAANRERVLRALAADGVLDANARRPLPAVPLRVGLITSVGSAAYHDFVHELERSGFAWKVCVVDVQVQGTAAARRIKWALTELSRVGLDAVVLVRGGGSRADLAPFDTELVARAIAAMPVPVLTGVGHEIDRSVADAVAYGAHKTPTACAQALVAQVRAFLDRLDELSHRIGGQARRRAAVAARELDATGAGLRRGAQAGMDRELARIDDRRHRLEAAARSRPLEADRQLEGLGHRVAELGRHHLGRASLRVEGADAVVRALDPRRVLERGYSVTRDERGRVIRRVADTGAGSLLVTEIADGSVTSRVERVAGDTR